MYQNIPQCKNRYVTMFQKVSECVNGKTTSHNADMKQTRRLYSYILQFIFSLVSYQVLAITTIRQHCNQIVAQTKHVYTSPVTISEQEQ